jgi:cobalt-zinc-cadmium efflux system protein
LEAVTAAPGHSHGALPGAHQHGITADADRSRLRAALALILGFMAVEVAVGILASSLALISDAGHMLPDAGAIGFALVAIRLAARPPRGDFTFGLKRAEILAAQLNGATLVVLGGFIVYEGIQRLVSPPDTEGLAVLAVAIAGIAVNLLATLLISGANRRSLNVEGAYQHILTDQMAFVATAVAGAVIVITGFDRADGIAALLVAMLIFRSAFGLLRDSGRILLEAAPAGLDPVLIGRAMAAEPDVVNVHDLHLWEVTSGFPALSAHVLVGEEADCHAERRRLEEMLHERFQIDHVTLQVEHMHAPLLQIQDAPTDPDEP